MSIPMVALTGGPGAGKSTVNKAIGQRWGELVTLIPEAASPLLDGGFPKPGVDVPLTDRWSEDFQKPLFYYQLGMESQYIVKAQNGPSRLIVCDRGAKEGEAYLGKGEQYFLDLFGVTKQELLGRYDMVIHMESLAVHQPELYEKIVGSNPARYEKTAAEAAHRDATIKEVWKDHPNLHIISSEHDLEYVTNAVMRLISRYLTQEIEKKWWLPEPPLISLPEGKLVRQGYFNLDTEMRLRQMDKEYYLTIKGNGDLSRAEYEYSIPQELFSQLWPETIGRRIKKTRYFIPYNGYTIELDRYQTPACNGVTFECEFQSVLEAERFELPDWAQGAIDITKTAELKNRSLALHGWPKVLHTLQGNFELA